ncbi:MAG: helix-turn-helix domain-containing protein, partial [Deltaproteobacteria bacterium]|nr:helix-turn-helix domain-containing protein [Deltaproteobacteria bacterium]
PDGQIDIQHLPPKINGAGVQVIPSKENNDDLSQERENFLKALIKAGGNQSEAARILGVSRVTIWKRIKKFKIDIQTEIKNRKEIS